MKSIRSILTGLLIIINLSLNAQTDESIDLLQNIDSREKISLNGMWDIIVDPLENGYYNHRLQPKEVGYFSNEQMQKPTDLIEYNYETSLQLMVPGDWNTQMKNCTTTKELFGIKRTLNILVKRTN